MQIRKTRFYTDILSELDECLYINITLQEIVLHITSSVDNIPSFSTDITDIVNSVIKGVTRKKLIQIFLLECYYYSNPEWIELLLRKKLYYKLVKHILILDQKR